MSVSWIFDNEFLIPSYSLEILSFKPWKEYNNVWKEKNSTENKYIKRFMSNVCIF